MVSRTRLPLILVAGLIACSGLALSSWSPAADEKAERKEPCEVSGTSPVVLVQVGSMTDIAIPGTAALFHTDKIEEDVFWMQSAVVDSASPNSAVKHVFVGNHFAYRFNRNIRLDASYLFLVKDNHTFARQKAFLEWDMVNTFSTRFVGQAGERDQYLWDIEGALQFDNDSNQTTQGDRYVVGVGYWLKDLPGTPIFWIGYDHTSGSMDPTNGTGNQAFNPLFPTDLNEFNREDLFGLQNLNDLHLEVDAFPAHWLCVTVGYHILNLDEARDALYNLSGSAVRQDETGRSSVDVGDAVNATIQLRLDNHQFINISYAHLFSGAYVRKTAVNNSAAAGDSDFLFVTYSLKW